MTECLYSSNPNLSPGQLTDLRQALVNNNIFAKIAVEYDYHKYLKYSSPQWFNQINHFVLQLEDDKKEGKSQVQLTTKIQYTGTNIKGEREYV